MCSSSLLFTATEKPAGRSIRGHPPNPKCWDHKRIPSEARVVSAQARYKAQEEERRGSRRGSRRRIWVQSARTERHEPYPSGMLLLLLPKYHAMSSQWGCPIQVELAIPWPHPLLLTGQHTHVQKRNVAQAFFYALKKQHYKISSPGETFPNFLPQLPSQGIHTNPASHPPSPDPSGR